jgi:hypothetical protein
VSGIIGRPAEMFPPEAAINPLALEIGISLQNASRQLTREEETGLRQPVI